MESRICHINWNGNYFTSTAEKTMDILGQKEIIGVGQLIEPPFRYKDYVLANDADEYYAFLYAYQIPCLQ